jgi:hypothetical protein
MKINNAAFSTSEVNSSMQAWSKLGNEPCVLGVLGAMKILDPGRCSRKQSAENFLERRELDLEVLEEEEL